MMIQNHFTALGIMSGTSLDGLDLALCRFGFQNGQWSYRLLNHTTIAYSSSWKKRLAEAPRLSGCELMQADAGYALYIASAVNRFLKNCRSRPEVIGSHGHTVFHQPENGLTFQLGSGAVIAAMTGIDVVTDFRMTDVSLGGQGAPLVPVGDELLFGHYDVCLNIGGIANLSFRKNKRRWAYDLCPANMILNKLSSLLGKPYDKNGAMASAGQVHSGLLHRLNGLPYYHQPFPKSLGREWFEHVFFPVIKKTKIPVHDLLATCTEHVAMQIAGAIERLQKQPCRVMVTGGGAKNTFLLKRISHHTAARMVLPDESLIDMKEAILFAFLAVLRTLNRVNCLKSVTGARHDTISGAWYKGR
jgi:anhydro-N-acetylmuramic acid kinase